MTRINTLGKKLFKCRTFEEYCAAAGYDPKQYDLTRSALTVGNDRRVNWQNMADGTSRLFGGTLKGKEVTLIIENGTAVMLELWLAGEVKSQSAAVTDITWAMGLDVVVRVRNPLVGLDAVPPSGPTFATEIILNGVKHAAPKNHLRLALV